jgi:uncharacterized protein with ParB-like and HNH nuclease domain/5-methylcytosine-specific restriction endonuclease McrA
MSIVSILNQIKNDEIVLPATQRNFVWSENQILKLLDSIMRGYSIGITLIWETYGNIQYRKFLSDYREDNLLTFISNSQQKRLRLVLDGQQRLQSLYLALYGTLEGKRLYFDILSGKESDDISESKYLFYFRTDEEADKWNDYPRTQANLPEGERVDDYTPEWYVKVSDIFRMSTSEKKTLARSVKQELSLLEEDMDRLSTNLEKFDDAFYKQENILKASVIDENLPHDNPERKSEADILEMFVRVNTGGTKLERSDLIFSLLKLSWKESASAFPKFVKEINSGNDFDLDEDFVIRCLFVISDLGSKFDVTALRKKSDIEKMKTNFRDCCNAIRATVDFIQQQCWCASSDIIGNYYNLVPFVYYLFHTKKHVVPNNQVERVRKAFFLFAFTKPFSRHADSRLRKFVNDQLKPLADKSDSTFPYEDTIRWIAYYENIKKFDQDVLKRNVSLALHLMQGLSGGKVKYDRNMPEVDHIFPKATLYEKDFDESEVNHFANFWILAQNKNRNKTNKHPRKYFVENPEPEENVSSSEMKRALIDPVMLDFRMYRSFLKNRGEQMLKRVANKIGFKDEEFNLLQKD